MISKLEIYTILIMFFGKCVYSIIDPLILSNKFDLGFMAYNLSLGLLCINSLRKGEIFRVKIAADNKSVKNIKLRSLICGVLANYDLILTGVMIKYFMMHEPQEEISKTLTFLILLSLFVIAFLLYRFWVYLSGGVRPKVLLGQFVNSLLEGKKTPEG